MEGDVAAMKEIGDRLDGKPARGVDLGVEVAVTHIERSIVDPQALGAPRPSANRARKSPARTRG